MVGFGKPVRDYQDNCFVLGWGQIIDEIYG